MQETYAQNIIIQDIIQNIIIQETCAQNIRGRLKYIHKVTSEAGGNAGVE